MNLSRKRTTFRDARTLDIANSVDFWAYGPETASVYETVQKLMAEAKHLFHESTRPIIQAAMQRFPKGSFWWEGDSELARKYQQCWESYKFWRSEAFAMMQEAAWADTDRFYTAQEQREPQPLVIQPTPQSAYEWRVEFGETAWEPVIEEKESVQL